MTKADLVERVAAQCQVSRSQAATVVDILLRGVVEALQHGDKVELRGFGSFRVRQRGSHRGRNPKTGERVEVPARRLPYFKPGKELRSRLIEVID